MEEETNQKSKIAKGVLLVFIGILIGAIICGIATENITLKNKQKAEILVYYKVITAKKKTQLEQSKKKKMKQKKMKMKT